MFTSWKTSLTGIGMIAFGIIGLAVGKLTYDVATSAILAGLGLIFAKDSNVTGGTKEQ